jgi:hypothetical protein
VTASLYKQCVLRRGNAYYKALWIPSPLARVGNVIDVKVTHPYEGHWQDWSLGWTVHEVWGEEDLRVKTVKTKSKKPLTFQSLYPAKARKAE